jgi:hypothetical protein
MKSYKAIFTVVRRVEEQHVVFIRADDENTATDLAIEVDLNDDSLDKTLDKDIQTSELQYLEIVK